MPTVHPRLRELLAAQAHRESPAAMAERTPAAVRRGALEVVHLQRPPAELRAVWDLPASSSSGVGARVYRPHGDPSALIVYFHGGGFVIDGAGHDAPLRDLAAATGCTIIAPEVRLAPEHRFPAALDDARRFTRWALRAAEAELGGFAAVGIAGDSSGGNLAATVAREEPGVGFQVLVYPMLDATGGSASYREFATGDGFTDAKSRWYYDQYLPPGLDRRDPLVSPLFGAELEGLPPTLVVTAECDPLRDEGESYAGMIRAAGGRATVKRYDGMIHGFFQMTALDAARRAQRDIGAWIRDELAGSNASVKIDNRHERLVAAPPERVAGLLSELGRIWPAELAPAPVEQERDVLEAGPMLWQEIHRAGAVRAFRVVAPDALQAEHWFEVEARAGGTVLRHVVSGRVAGAFAAVWRERIEPLHDRILEALLDNVEAASCG